MNCCPLCWCPIGSRTVTAKMVNITARRAWVWILGSSPRMTKEREERRCHNQRKGQPGNIERQTFTKKAVEYHRKPWMRICRGSLGALRSPHTRHPRARPEDPQPSPQPLTAPSKPRGRFRPSIQRYQHVDSEFIPAFATRGIIHPASVAGVFRETFAGRQGPAPLVEP